MATSEKGVADGGAMDADLLYGVPRIAESLGVTDRQARHLADTGAIPTFKLPGNKIVCARRSTLTAWLAEQEARASKVREPEAAPVTAQPGRRA